MFSNAHSRTLAPTGLLVIAVCLAGCEPPRTLQHYSVLAGKVVACRTDTGELSVRGTRRAAAGPIEETTYCLITRDSEVYMNDRFSSIEDIQLGDAIELIGRRVSDSQLDRFVVSFAYLDHPLPVPPQPDLAPASAPAPKDTTDLPDKRED